MGQDKTKGSASGWNAVWKNQAGEAPLNPLYTTVEPTSLLQFWQRAYANDLLSLLADRDYTDFCELGAGRGTTSMYLAAAGYDRITMVDLAPEGFATAERSFGAHDLPLPKMLLENVEQTSLTSQSFDCIYNIGLLEHFTDPKPTLAEAYRLLRPGGMIFMPIVPEQPLYKGFWQHILLSPLNLAKKLVKKVLGRRKQLTAIHRTDYRRDFYIDICQDLGYKKIQCIPYNPYWRVNANRQTEGRLTLPVYRWYYNTFKRNKNLSLRTGAAFELCFLLLAEKG